MKKRVLSALLALCLTLSLAGAAFAENETLSPAQETSVSESASSAAEPASEEASEPEQKAEEDITESSSGASSESQPATKAESTPVPTAAAAASNVTEKETESATSKDEVEISTAETAQEPSYPAQDFEAEVEGTEVVVNVSAPEGALPEDVILTASLVGSSEDNADDQAVADVAAELGDAGVEYDGFVALDISFVDADGNKVEPLQPVNVNFTLPAELLPEDVDASTLEVQHLKENEAGEVEEVETVADTADATEGTVTVDGAAVTLSEDADTTLSADAAVTAEFEVDGFSTFTITWNGHPEGEDGKQKTMDFSVVDTDGKEITVDSSLEEKLSYNLKDGSEVSFEEIVSSRGINTITASDGTEYVFQNATLVLNDGRDRHPVDSVQRFETGNDYIIVDTRKYELRFKDSVYGENGFYTRDSLNDGERVELVYRRAQDDEDIVEPEPTYSKQVVQQSDGSYTLSLSVSGDVGSSSKNQKVDVLFIIDSSDSMKDGFGNKSRIEAVADAIEELTTTFSQKEGIDERFAVVQFGDEIKESSEQKYYRDGLQLVSWTNDKEYLMSKVNSISCSSGTNYQAGLLDAQASLIETRPDALKYVVFLSDGAPTRYYKNDGTQQGSGYETPSNINYSLNAAIEEAKKLPALNGFFTVFVGSGDAAGNLVTLSDNVKAEDRLNETASNIQELTTVFNKITGQITALTCTDVHVSDELSAYVEPVEGANAELSISKMEIVNGKPQAVPIEKTDTVYSEVQVSLEKGNLLKLNTVGNNALRPDYIYTVSLNIRATDKAYQEKATNGYNATGELNTGSYAGKEGFHSNNSATLEYSVNGEKENPKTFPRPVIQVPSTNLTINKKMESLPKEQWDAAADEITFTVKDGQTAVATINLGTDPAEDANYTIQIADTGYQVVVTGLTVTKSYTVTETCDKLQGYTVTSDLAADGQQVTMNKNSTVNVLNVTNSYTPDNQTLTITKTVGGEMGSYTDDFTFDLVLSKIGQDGKEAYYGTALDIVKEGTTAQNEKGEIYTGTLTSQGNGTYTFVLSNDEQMVLSIPYGYNVWVRERQENNGYSVKSRNYVTGTTNKPGLDLNRAYQTINAIDKDYTVEFENNRDPVAPTGLEDNHTKPFGLMVGVAVMAGLALAGGAVVRRRRRWME